MLSWCFDGVVSDVSDVSAVYAFMVSRWSGEWCVLFHGASMEWRVMSVMSDVRALMGFEWNGEWCEWCIRFHGDVSGLCAVMVLSSVVGFHGIFMTQPSTSPTPSHACVHYIQQNK